MKSKLLLITGIALFASQTMFAQGTSVVTKYGLPKPKDFSRFSVGIYGGLSIYQGDVREKYAASNSDQNFTPQACYGLQLGYQMSHTLGLQLKFGSTKFHQEPSDSIYVPGLDKRYLLNFESPVTEGALNLTFSFGNISFLSGNTKSKLHFVVNTGVGLMTHEATLKDRSNNNTIIYQGNKTTEVYVPFGFGIKYKIGPVDLGLMFDYNKMFTDNVDGITAGYAYDGYSHLELALNYTFGKKQKMEWVNPMQLVYNDISQMKDKVDGLTNDKDKDGVSDIFDKDNSTPVGVMVYGDGTSADTDGDGVADFKDEDPYSKPKAKVDARGIELDSDNDGVGDLSDKEPNTPAGTLVNFQGISLTNVGKGSDANTNLYTKEIINNNGGLGFLPSIFFDLGKSTIKTTYYERLLMIARVMKMNPDLKFTIVGSTDQAGKNEANKKLGMARAEAIKKHMISIYGIDPARMATTTVGMDEPLAKPIKTTDYLNRRVDFRINSADSSVK